MSVRLSSKPRTGNTLRTSTYLRVLLGLAAIAVVFGVICSVLWNAWPIPFPDPHPDALTRQQEIGRWFGVTAGPIAFVVANTALAGIVYEGTKPFRTPGRVGFWLVAPVLTSLSGVIVYWLVSLAVGGLMNLLR